MYDPIPQTVTNFVTSDPAVGNSGVVDARHSPEFQYNVRGSHPALCLLCREIFGEASSDSRIYDGYER